MDQTTATTTTTPLPWATQTLGEQMVATAWRAVGAHLRADRANGSGAAAAAAAITGRAGQVATGGAGASDGVTDDALLPPAVRERLG